MNLRTLWLIVTTCSTSALGDGSPFAAVVLDYAPAPGQFVNDPDLSDAGKALGAPVGNGSVDGNDSDVVSLGGFGGSITLAFDHPVIDDPANPMGLDAIVFGNAFWPDGNANRRWAECAHIEISFDATDNGLPDDPWYLIPGSHLADPVSALVSQTWDDDTSDSTNPPAMSSWIPSGIDGEWTTSAFELPSAVFRAIVLANPNGLAATTEGVFGYGDLSPTAVLGDVDGDNLSDDQAVAAEWFYTAPDDPFTVGVTPGSAGGDAFDIALAVDASTGQAAALPGFHFIRITTAVNAVHVLFGEKSAEIDAVADVRPVPFGDADGDGDVDAFDAGTIAACLFGPTDMVEPIECLRVDGNLDSRVDLRDVAAFGRSFTGAS